MGTQTSSPTFTEKDVEVLIKTSGKTETEIRQWYDDFHAETGQTGRMNKRQFKQYYSRLRNKSNLDPLTDHIFRAFDTDNSGRSFFCRFSQFYSYPLGTIEFPEFLIAFIATTDRSTHQKLEYAFEVYDINDDQCIQKKEVEKILSIVCRLLGFSEEETQAYIYTMMLSFDANRDKVLTKSEFIEGCLHDPSLGKLSNPFEL